MILIAIAEHIAAIVGRLRREFIVAETLSSVFDTSDGVACSSTCVNALADSQRSRRIDLIRKGTWVPVNVASITGPVVVAGKFGWTS